MSETPGQDPNAQNVERTDEPAEPRGTELTEEERERRRQEHNEGYTHGGVTQIGDFDVAQQQEDRDKAAEEALGKASLNENDPALPTVTDEHLDADDDEDDRPVDDIKEQQGDLPANDGYGNRQ